MLVRMDTIMRESQDSVNKGGTYKGAYYKGGDDESEENEIAVVNGKKMAVLKRRQKHTTGTKGWPSAGGNNKPFKEVKFEQENQLKKMKTTFIDTPLDTFQEDSEFGGNEFTRFFCKTA